MALRSCSRNANDDDSRVHTAARSDCSFLCDIIRQAARLVKTRQLLAKVVSLQRSSHPDSRVAFYISSIFLSMTRRTRRGTELHVEHSQWRLCCGVACIIALPCPCGQKGRSISTGRFLVDASTVRISTSERTDHTLTGMENHKDAKNTLRRINLQRNAVKRNTTASTTGTSATRPSERR